MSLDGRARIHEESKEWMGSLHDIKKDFLVTAVVFSLEVVFPHH